MRHAPLFDDRLFSAPGTMKELVGPQRRIPGSDSTDRACAGRHRSRTRRCRSPAASGPTVRLHTPFSSFCQRHGLLDHFEDARRSHQHHFARLGGEEPERDGPVGVDLGRDRDVVGVLVIRRRASLAERWRHRASKGRIVRSKHRCWEPPPVFRKLLYTPK